MKKFIIGSLLFFLLLLTILHNSFASTYTLTWCRVKNAGSYFICMGNTTSTFNGGQFNNYINSPQCDGIGYWTVNNTIDINLQDNKDYYIQILSYNIVYDQINNKLIFIYSNYSYPVTVIGGITSPIINCGC